MTSSTMERTDRNGAQDEHPFGASPTPNELKAGGAGAVAGGVAGTVTGGAVGAAGGGVVGWGIGMTSGTLLGLIVGVFMGLAIASTGARASGGSGR
jgi:hypothetical protein